MSDKGPDNNIQQIEQKLRLEKEYKGGAGWFYWLAGLSLVNSIVALFGGNLNFAIGLGITQIVDGMALGLYETYGNFIIKALALGVDFCVSGIFILFGVFANKRHKWAFVTGMILYSLDSLIFLLTKSYLGLAFHAFALYFIYKGFKASKEIAELENSLKNDNYNIGTEEN
ncbi:MAG: hypothetical protein ACOYWZ_14665 [Bacillota bacterium]